MVTEETTLRKSALFDISSEMFLWDSFEKPFSRVWVAPQSGFNLYPREASKKPVQGSLGGLGSTKAGWNGFVSSSLGVVLFIK